MALRAINCYNPAGISFILADATDEAGTITVISSGDEAIRVCQSIDEVILRWHQWTTRGRCMLGSFDFLTDAERDFLTYGTFRVPETRLGPAVAEEVMVMGAIAGQARI